MVRHDNTNPMALPPDAGEAICSSRESQVIADHALASQLHIAGTNQSRPGVPDPRIWSSMGFGAWTSYNLRIKISPDVLAATPGVQSAVSSHRASWRKGLNIRHPELRRSPARLYLCTRVLLSNIRDPPSGWPLAPARGGRPTETTHTSGFAHMLESTAEERESSACGRWCGRRSTRTRTNLLVCLLVSSLVV